jgi:hypothetical protein
VPWSHRPPNNQGGAIPPPPTHTSLIDEAARFDRYGPPSSVGDAAPHASLDLRDTREGEGPATTFLGHTPPELP